MWTGTHDSRTLKRGPHWSEESHSTNAMPPVYGISKGTAMIPLQYVRCVIEFAGAVPLPLRPVSHGDARETVSSRGRHPQKTPTCEERSHICPTDKPSVAPASVRHRVCTLSAASRYPGSAWGTGAPTGTRPCGVSRSTSISRTNGIALVAAGRPAATRPTLPRAAPSSRIRRTSPMSASAEPRKRPRTFSPKRSPLVPPAAANEGDRSRTGVNGPSPRNRPRRPAALDRRPRDP